MGRVESKQNTPLIHQLIRYISEKGQEFDSFGMLHLNKILYAADFESIREKGESITGATYKKQKFGAVASCMKPVLDELEGKLISIEKKWHFTHIQKKPLPIGDENYSLITEEIKDRIDKWIAELGKLSANEVKDKFHDQAYWRLLEIGDIIPPESAFWPDHQNREITEKDKKAVTRFKQKFGDRVFSRPSR